MDFLKIYILKIICAILALIGLVLYLFGFNMNIVATILALGGVILFIDTKINKDNIYLANLKIMSKSKKK